MADVTYLLPVGDTLREAWQKVRGTKASVWAAMLILIAISLLMQLLVYLIKSVAPPLSGVVSFIFQVIQFLLQMGTLYIGIERARDNPISWKMMFRTFEWDLGLKVILLYILQILLFLPFIILIFAGVVVQTMNTAGDRSMLLLTIALIAFGIIGTIWLMIRMYVAMGFVIDRKTRPWESIKLSFQATRSNFWHLLGIMIIFFLIMIVAAIPFFIGWIWIIPMGYVLYGLIYKNLTYNLTATPIITQPTK